MPDSGQPGEAQNADSGPQIDWNAALEAVAGKRRLLVELTQIFLSEYPRLEQEIRRAIAAGDGWALRLHAHALKGNLRYFGVTSAVELARGLEQQGKAGQLDGVESEFERLQAAVEALIPHMHEFIRSPGGDGPS